MGRQFRIQGNLSNASNTYFVRWNVEVKTSVGTFTMDATYDSAVISFGVVTIASATPTAPTGYVDLWAQEVSGGVQFTVGSGEAVAAWFVPNATMYLQPWASLTLVARGAGETVTAGPPTITYNGPPRTYQWESYADWVLVTDWNVVDGSLTYSSSDRPNGTEALWDPQDGPVAVTAPPGAPTFTVTTEHGFADNDTWLDITAKDAEGAVDDRFSLLGVQYIYRCYGIDAWMTTRGQWVYVISGFISGLNTGPILSTEGNVILVPVHPAGSIKMVATAGYCPRALQLLPSNDVLLFFIDQTGLVQCQPLTYQPMNVSVPYALGNDGAPYDVDVQAVSLGEPWLTSNGQVSLPYTAPDGTVNVIYGDASGATWTA